MLITYLGKQRNHKEWAKRFGMSRMSGNPFNVRSQKETEDMFAERVRSFLDKRERGLKTQPWRRESGEHL